MICQAYDRGMHPTISFLDRVLWYYGPEEETSVGTRSSSCSTQLPVWVVLPSQTKFIRHVFIGFICGIYTPNKESRQPSRYRRLGPHGIRRRGLTQIQAKL